MFWFLMLFLTFDVLFLTFDEVIFDVLTLSQCKQGKIMIWGYSEKVNFELGLRKLLKSWEPPALHHLWQIVKILNYFEFPIRHQIINHVIFIWSRRKCFCCQKYYEKDFFSRIKKDFILFPKIELLFSILFP
jgi:hypothetical protein